MRKRSIKRNYIYNVLQQCFAMIIPLIMTPYLARVLGADGVGTVSYVEAIASYFTLFAAMGMPTFGRREISYVQGDKEKRTQVFWEVILLEGMTSFFALLAFIFFAIRQVNTEMYLVLIFNIMSVVADVTWFFQGIEEFRQIVLRSMIFKCIIIVYTFLLVRNKTDVTVYLLGVSFFTFLSHVSLWLYLTKFIGVPKWQELRPFRHIHMILSLFLPTIAMQIYTVFDKTMIGIITKDSFENGYYEQAIKMSKLILTVITSLGTVMIPRIGYCYAQKDTNEVRRLMYCGYRFVWFLGIPLCFGLIMIADNFVPWFLGIGYDKVSTLLKILAFLILVIGLSNVTGLQYLVPTNRQNLLTITVILGAIVNFCMNLILVPRYQSIGAAIASVIAETVVTVAQIWLVRKELSPLKVFMESMPYWIAGLGMLMILYWVEKNLVPSKWNTLVIVITGIITYFLMLLILRDQFVLPYIKKFLDKFIWISDKR